MHSVIHATTFIAVFIASLAGSFHCLGMCGGLVVVAGTQKQSPFVGQLVYHLGRGFAYLTLGALSGYAGESILRGIVDHDRWYLLPAITALIALLLYAFFVRTRNAQLYAINTPRVATVISMMAKFPLLLGVTTMLLPCAWLYSFVALAAGNGSTLGGIKVMLAFWLGTLPALLAAGTVFEKTIRSLTKKYSLLPVIFVTLAAAASISLHLVGEQHAGHAVQMPGVGLPAQAERCVQ